MKKEEFDAVIRDISSFIEPFPKTHEVEGEEVVLYRVGRNATHEFYLGILSDGRLVKASYGEDWGEVDWDEAQAKDECPSPEFKFNIRVLNGDDFGYIGHF